MLKGTLYLQSSYSMLRSLIPLDQLVDKALEFNYSFLALTDESLHGIKEFFDLTKNTNIKPIVGITIKISEPNEDLFLVYVKNNNGYENLLKLSYLKETNHKFHINDLVTYSTNLIIVSGGVNSLIDKTINYGNSDSILEDLEKYNNLFNDFYIGLSSNDIKTKNVLIPFYQANNLFNKYKFVTIHETNYLEKKDFDVYNKFIKIDDINNKLEVNLDNSFKDLEFFNEFFENKIYNNDEFINSITFTYPKIKYHLPEFDTSSHTNSEKYLFDLSHRGLKRRLYLNKINDDTIYVERLNHELEVINEMGFSNYFLIVYDFIREAKQNDILVGPGRGSAAGSLVAYSLGITEVDPIKYNLLFERFLNPMRVTMPDIDIDFPDDKRDLVIDYVRGKYGDNNICSISTFSKLQLKSSVRDIARVLNVEADRASKIIRAMNNNNIDKTDRVVNEIVEIASKIEGMYRQTGTHPAGIILSKEDLTKSIPMQEGSYSFNQSQFDMDTLEDLGLLKIDFLGLRNLTVIKEVLDILKEQGNDLNIYNLELDNDKTYNLLKNAETTGIFQLESYGMKRVLKKLKPNTFEDIVATLALYRPGPMDNIDIYIKRKEGESFNYIDDSIKEILKPTYGIIIYQEQIMEIARVFAGYNLFEADNLRVGISKKDKKVLREERGRFIEKSVSMGRNEQLANEIYNYIVRFADYGFNRSHSVSYASVSYWMAYLKANHYLVFMKVLLDSVIGNSDLTRNYINEVKSKGYKVLSPNINVSTNKYLIEKHTLIMPLSQVRGIGIKVYNNIIDERNKGLFKSFDDFKERVVNILNEGQIKALIYANALDLFDYNKKTLIANSSLDDVEMRKFIKDFVITEEEDYSFVEKNSLELEYLGLNIEYSISNYLKERFKNTNYLIVSDLIISKNKNNVTLGVIREIRIHTTKNNKEMAFINLVDDTGVADLVIFSDNFNLVSGINVNDIVAVKVTKNEYQNKISYIVNDLKKITIK